ncbi:MAG: MotA/TolQ/ExbB proton channel family protein, partial [Phycisphaerae bacterium]|nr:MotA/TolQ/ExbB proton channel family protein [Phycisphaerae bacterium]
SGQALVDPTAVSGGISEALVATASGLVVALLALFPYMAFGAQRESTVGRLETLISVAQIGLGTTALRASGTMQKSSKQSEIVVGSSSDGT